MAQWHSSAIGQRLNGAMTQRRNRAKAQWRNDTAAQSGKGSMALKDYVF